MSTWFAWMLSILASMLAIFGTICLLMLMGLAVQITQVTHEIKQAQLLELKARQL